MCSAVNHTSYSFFGLSTMLVGGILAGFVMAVTAGEPAVPADSQPDHPASFMVTTNGGLISVNAKEVPLKDVIERIGQELGIDVEVQIGGQEKITAEFQDLPLDAALKRLSRNYAYTTDKEGEEITKVFLFAKGENSPSSDTGVGDTSTTRTGRRAGSSEPFKFEFDPMEAMDQAE